MEKLDFPNRITVELTNQCNLSCTFCPRQDVPMEIGHMDLALYRKIIDEAAEHLPIKLVIFFRGESLLHPRFFECVEYAKERGIGPIQFASNGYALDDAAADKLLKTGVDFISFSLDTLNQQVYKKTRKYGDLSTCVEHVIHLSEKCRDRKKQGLPVPTIQISTIETEDYIDEQQAFIDFWKQYADIIRVYYEHDDNGRFRNPNVRQKLPEMAGRLPCRKVFTDLLIYWNGDLALCNYDWRGELFLNVNEMSIQEAWHSKQYERIRKIQNSGALQDASICRECEHWRIDYLPDGFLGKMYRGNA